MLTKCSGAAHAGVRLRGLAKGRNQDKGTAMEGVRERTQRKARPWRIIGWGGVVFALLLPLAAMQFTDEVDWSPGDFVFAALMIGVAGLTLELAVRTSFSLFYRAGVAAAVAAGFFLVWANGAVGLIGSERNPDNLMYFGVLAVAIFASAVARFRAAGMAWAMAAAAIVQALVPLIAVAGGYRGGKPLWIVEIVAVTGFFCAMWLVSAGLFWLAVRR